MRARVRCWLGSPHKWKEKRKGKEFDAREWRCIVVGRRATAYGSSVAVAVAVGGGEATPKTSDEEHVNAKTRSLTVSVTVSSVSVSVSVPCLCLCVCVCVCVCVSQAGELEAAKASTEKKTTEKSNPALIAVPVCPSFSLLRALSLALALSVYDFLSLLAPLPFSLCFLVVIG